MLNLTVNEAIETYYIVAAEVKLINKKVAKAIYSDGCYSNHFINAFVTQWCYDNLDGIKFSVVTTGVDKCSLFLFLEFVGKGCGIKYNIIRINNGLVIIDSKFYSGQDISDIYLKEKTEHSLMWDVWRKLSGRFYCLCLSISED